MIAQALLPSSREKFLRARNQELGPIAWQSGPGNGKRGNTRPVTLRQAQIQIGCAPAARLSVRCVSGGGCFAWWQFPGRCSPLQPRAGAVHSGPNRTGTANCVENHCRLLAAQWRRCGAERIVRGFRGFSGSQCNPGNGAGMHRRPAGWKACASGGGRAERVRACGLGCLASLKT